MHTSGIWPILRPLHQSRPHRILPDVLPFLAVALAIAQSMMKPTRLKRSGIGMRFGEAVFPEAHPPFDGEFQITRRAEQMQMIWHKQVIAYEPGRGGVVPDVVQRTLHRRLCEPTPALLRADGEEHPVRSTD